MLTDPISDMLTRIRNAALVGKAEVVCPLSRVKYEIAKILEKEGYVLKVEKKDKNDREIKIVLKDAGHEPAIRHIARVSSPGKRVYVSYKDIPKVLNDQGLAVVSTSAGIMAGSEARKRHLGGEVICEVY
jgi:small subunit ribosomal protein S8